MAEKKKRLKGQSGKEGMAIQSKEKRVAIDTAVFKHPNLTIYLCYQEFMLVQKQRGNAKQTLDFYNRFFIKFEKYLEALPQPQNIASFPVEFLSYDIVQAHFMEYLEGEKLGVQTINSYLRAYRAFGKWCLKEEYIERFSCPIKEVEPPVKEVYTDKELKALLRKPKIEEFSNFRSYCIISLILSTGARSNTILNIRIKDLELDEGYVNFNTTKARKVARLGLDNKTKKDLMEWINYWRSDAEDEDFLFCNEYGEQLTRSGLDSSIARYNKSRGVEKTSIHLLRHTFAKKWITSGGDIITLSKVLTHSELAMVQRYSNLYSTDVKKEMDVHSVMAQMRTTNGKTIRDKK